MVPVSEQDEQILNTRTEITLFMVPVSEQDEQILNMKIKQYST